MSFWEQVSICLEFEGCPDKRRSNNMLGPAHAVYFATYEVVKQAMGGNASGHHPMAAGKPKISYPEGPTQYLTHSSF